MSNAFDDDGGFDPNAQPQEESREKARWLKERGTYALLITECRGHGSTKNGKRWSKFRFQVLFGPHTGCVFDDKIFRTAASAKRLTAYCRATGRTDKFKPVPNRNKCITEAVSDAHMERQFVGAALVAPVKIERGRDNPEIVFPEVKWPTDRAQLSDQQLTFLGRMEGMFAERADERLESIRAKVEEAESVSEEGGGFGDSGGFSDGGGFGDEDWSADDFRDDDFDQGAMGW